MRRELTAAGWVAHPLEPALFMLYDGDRLVGVLLTHVDDLLYAGSGTKFDDAMEKIKKDFYVVSNISTAIFLTKLIFESFRRMKWYQKEVMRRTKNL